MSNKPIPVTMAEPIDEAAAEMRMDLEQAAAFARDVTSEDPEKVDEIRKMLYSLWPFVSLLARAALAWKARAEAAEADAASTQSLYMAAVRRRDDAEAEVERLKADNARLKAESYGSRLLREAAEHTLEALKEGDIEPGSRIEKWTRTALETYRKERPYHLWRI